MLEYWDFVTAQDSSSSLSERESVEDESTHDEVTRLMLLYTSLSTRLRSGLLLFGGLLLKLSRISFVEKQDR